MYRLPEHWTHLPFFETQWPEIEAALQVETRQILPPQEVIFAALARSAPAAVRVVILGQDPYPTVGHAHGFAFSVSSHVTPLPRSLANIFRELEADVGARPKTGDLRFWADQGVLLLNDVLTVPEGTPRGHRHLGWQHLVPQVLAALNDQPRAFVLWGKDAGRHKAQLAGHGHLVLQSAHPSPLSARRGFFGSRPFSTVNAWLRDQGHTPINWISP